MATVSAPVEHKVILNGVSFSPSLPRFPIFAAFGVPEDWRYSVERVTMHRLQDGQYIEVSGSVAMPSITADALTHFLKLRKSLRSTPWVRTVRDWVRQRG